MPIGGIRWSVTRVEDRKFSVAQTKFVIVVRVVHRIPRHFAILRRRDKIKFTLLPGGILGGAILGRLNLQRGVAMERHLNCSDAIHRGSSGIGSWSDANGPAGIVPCVRLKPKHHVRSKRFLELLPLPYFSSKPGTILQRTDRRSGSCWSFGHNWGGSDGERFLGFAAGRHDNWKREDP